ncbi:MAG: hypothetical protein ACLFVK_05000 [Dehalococcoidia bacterium]
MAKSEDEYWANQKSNLRYCFRHKRYYKADVGCELCAAEQANKAREGAKSSSLDQCPDCGKYSLFWNERTRLYECLNPECKHNFTEREHVARSLDKQQKLSSSESRYNVEHKSKSRFHFGHEPSEPPHGDKSQHEYKLPLKVRIRRTTRKLTRPLFQIIRRFLRSRWFLIILGLTIGYLSIAYYSQLLIVWPFGGLDIVRWMEIPIQVLAGMLILIGVFSGRHRTRMKAARTALILGLIVSGATYGYHYLDESGQIDEWLGRTAQEETLPSMVEDKMIPSIAGLVGQLRTKTVELSEDDRSRDAADKDTDVALVESKLKEAMQEKMGDTNAMGDAEVSDKEINELIDRWNILTELKEKNLISDGNVLWGEIIHEYGEERTIDYLNAIGLENVEDKVQSVLDERYATEQLQPYKQGNDYNIAKYAYEAMQSDTNESEVRDVLADAGYGKGEINYAIQNYSPEGVRVWIDDYTYLSGIRLFNKPDARNPSWSELKTFLRDDMTDQKQYVPGSFVCADFAEMLHNNAEREGLRCAYVSLQLGPCPSWPSAGGHALNAFETTDRGLVYIDCTGPRSSRPKSADKIVDVEVGQEYIPRSIFPEAGWSPTWESMGKVKEIEVIQW